MGIALIGNNFPLTHFGGRNPVQNAATLVTTVLVLNALSSFPMAKAEASNLEKEICEKICSPLPGGKDDFAEKICQETCKKDGVITRARTWIGSKAGEWTEYAKPFGSLIDCGIICGEASGAVGAIATKVVADTASSGWKIAAAKATARAMCVIPSQVGGSFGYAACMACCNGLRYTGTI